jgi:hypothetical protein
LGSNFTVAIFGEVNQIGEIPPRPVATPLLPNLSKALPKVTKTFGNDVDNSTSDKCGESKTHSSALDELGIDDDDINGGQRRLPVCCHALRDKERKRERDREKTLIRFTEIRIYFLLHSGPHFSF